MTEENQRKLTAAILIMAMIRRRRFGKRKIVRRHSSVLIKPCLTNRDRKSICENAYSDDNERFRDTDEVIEMFIVQYLKGNLDRWEKRNTLL